MRIPVLRGLIDRRILVNFRLDPEAVKRVLPAPFRPKLVKGHAMGGICLIRVKEVRPRLLPGFVGIGSENGALRFSVQWDEDGEVREGVYIPRRDTDSALNHLAGGRVFPGEHNKAEFNIEEKENEIDFAMKSVDGKVSVRLKGAISEDFPANSIFSSLAEASKFFEKGSLGYSVTKSGKCLDGINLEIKDWQVEILKLDFVESSFYNNPNVFPQGSIEFDHVLLMKNVAHEWHSVPRFDLK